MEMTFENDIGYSVKIESDLSVDKILFSETGGFVVEVSLKNINIVKSVFLNYGLDINFPLFTYTSFSLF